MEKLILEIISKHGKDKKVTRGSQYGFAMGQSCLTNHNILQLGGWLSGWGESSGYCLPLL